MAFQLSSIELVLAGLGKLYEQKFPEVVSSLGPGLGESVIDELEKALYPYLLPEEVRALYRWHDGIDHQLSPLAPKVLLSLQEAIDRYKHHIEIFKDFGSWNPLWFPVVDCWDGECYFTVLSRERRSISPLFRFYCKDPDVSIVAPSLEVLMHGAARCMEEDVYTLQDGRLESDYEEQDRVLGSAGCYAEGDWIEGVHYFSGYRTRLWPEEWKAAIGIGPDAYKLEGATCRIAEYLARPKREVVRGHVVALMGTAGMTQITLKDSSGELVIQCATGTVGAREMRIREDFEITVEPCLVMVRAPFDVPDAVAVKVVPLR